MITMAKAIATKDLVYKCAEELTREGVEPTTLTVQAITRGSYTTVGRHLEEWRNEREERLEQILAMPQEFNNGAQRFVVDVWKAASKEASKLINAFQSQAQQRIDSAKRSRQEALQVIVQLEKSEQLLKRKIDALAEKVIGLEIALGVKRAQQDDLRSSTNSRDSKVHKGK
jgi:hypothetical protein